MNREDHSEFWKTGLHRPMTTGEEAVWQSHLADQPEALAQFDEELKLNRLIQQLPDAPVSSNFTAQVMRLIELEHRRKSPPTLLRKWADYIAFGWGRKLAFTSALLLLGFLSYHQYQVSARRQLVRSIAPLFRVLPGDGMIADFKAIDGLRKVSAVQTTEPDLLLEALR